jgi:hypothetical protein
MSPSAATQCDFFLSLGDSIVPVATARYLVVALDGRYFGLHLLQSCIELKKRCCGVVAGLACLWKQFGMTKSSGV